MISERHPVGQAVVDPLNAQDQRRTKLGPLITNVRPRPLYIDVWQIPDDH